MKSYPRIQHRKDRNLAYIYQGRKKIYLGVYGSQEALIKYAEIVAGRKITAPSETTSEPTSATVKDPLPPKENKVTVQDLFKAYIREYKTRPAYSVSDINRLKRASNIITVTSKRIPVSSFGIKEMREIRDFLLSKKFKQGGESKSYTRGYINKLLGTIKTVFRWGVNELLCNESDYIRVKCFDLVKEGRSIAREGTGYRMIEENEISAVLPYLQPIYRDMVLLLSTTGMRPSELCSIRADGIDMTGDIWIYSPRNHKTASKGKRRYIAFTATERAILARYMGDGGYLFTPAKALNERGISKTKRHLLPHIESITLGRRLKEAVKKAIKNNELKEGWSLYCLRHRAITVIRMRFGAEFAQHFAGHSSVTTQKFYDHSAEATVRKLAGER